MTLRIAVASLVFISIPRIAAAYVGGVVVLVYGFGFLFHLMACAAIAACRMALLGKVGKALVRRAFWVSFSTPFVLTPIVLLPLVYFVECDYEPIAQFAWYRLIGAVESGTSAAAYPLLLLLTAALGWYWSKPRTSS
jgi:hypothetical protein